MRTPWWPAAALALLAAPAHAQIPAARLTILEAEHRRAPTARDLAAIRTGTRSRDPQTARLAVRALGRLERPGLIADILPALGHPLPENRAEAANALAQAAQGFGREKPSAGNSTGSLLTALVARLSVEDEPSVRAVLAESIARVPYAAEPDLARAESALVDLIAQVDTVTDRVGVAKAFEAFVRLHRPLRTPGSAAIAALRRLFGLSPSPIGNSPAGRRTEIDPLRDARVRRLALEALIRAGAADGEVVTRGVADGDPQVRRLAALGAATTDDGADALATLAVDPAPMVRIEALRSLATRRDARLCATALTATDDEDAHVALAAIDHLAGCGSSPAAVARLTGAAQDLSRVDAPRAWHHAARAIVALAAAAPAEAADALGPLAASGVWQIRMYAARAAGTVGDLAVLNTLVNDREDNVVEAAIEGLSNVLGHSADATYHRALARTGHQVVRAAAAALAGSPDAPAAVAALNAAMDRLAAEGSDSSRDARAAIAATLNTLGAPPPAAHRTDRADRDEPPPWLSAEDLRRLAAPRARVRISRVGSFELALFTSEAPATVLRFVDLAESGYYDGLTFHRVVPNLVVQGGSPGANEYAGHARHMRDEVGLWPHVRGAVGVSTRGRDTGDAQFFVDLVDNPRFDHEYTVFAQVLNGIDVVDRILEGDVIESIEILP